MSLVAHCSLEVACIRISTCAAFTQPDREHKGALAFLLRSSNKTGQDLSRGLGMGICVYRGADFGPTSNLSFQTEIVNGIVVLVSHCYSLSLVKASLDQYKNECWVALSVLIPWYLIILVPSAANSSSLRQQSFAARAGRA